MYVHVVVPSRRRWESHSQPSIPLLYIEYVSNPGLSEWAGNGTPFTSYCELRTKLTLGHLIWNLIYLRVCIKHI